MLIPDRKAPNLGLPLTNGDDFKLSAQSPRHFTMLVFYRGKHCPICRKYLERISTRIEDIRDAGIIPVAISMDSEERAKVSHEEWDTGELPLAFGMSEEQAREWGLYISQKREGSEEPDRFAEPGLFLVQPDGTLFFAEAQSAPFTRPSIDELLQGVKFVTENDYPARGTLT